MALKSGFWGAWIKLRGFALIAAAALPLTAWPLSAGAQPPPVAPSKPVVEPAGTPLPLAQPLPPRPSALDGSVRARADGRRISTGAVGCDAAASALWTAGPRVLRVEAVSRGPGCANAVSMLVVRAPDGEPLWLEAFINKHNLALQGGTTPRTLQAALEDWIDPSKSGFKSTADLPFWRRNEPAPVAGEFPFYPDESYNEREAWEALRRAKAPMFCYTQGLESIACITWMGGRIEKVGAQSFPG
jgi:hypothetical protein